MRSALAAVVVVVALAGTLTATAAQTTTPRHGSAIQAPATPCDHHPHPAAEHRQLTHDVFAYSGWRSPDPGAGAVKTSRVLRSCLPDRVRARLSSDWHAAHADLQMQHDYRVIAPERGFSGEGRWLRWLPIPRYIVECETRGYSGDGRWHAANASGAQGPAQLLGWGAPYPATTDAERLAYWRMTAYVLNVQGLGAWACA